MNHATPLPHDLSECHRLLMAAFGQVLDLEKQLQEAEQRTAEAEQRTSEAEQRATEAEQRATEAEQRLEELQRVLEETAATHEKLRQKQAATLDQLAEYKRWAHGQRRERFREAEGQQHLFEDDSSATSELEDSLSSPEQADSPDNGQAEQQASRSRRAKREIDWDRFPQVVHEHELDENERGCSCCGRTMEQISEDITRELEFEPAKVIAHIHVRPQYACRHCQDGVSAATVEPRPIPGGLPGPGLIAEVVVSKFNDHLPLYRLEDILTRCGVYLRRSTLCDWVKSAAQLLQPLYDLQRSLVVQSSVMWTDDTSMVVLAGEQGRFQGYFWAYLGDQQHPYTVYDFTANRTRAGPISFLEGYSGYLHADAFSGYDAVFTNLACEVGLKILEVACWAHARRKFFNAVNSYPRQAHQVLQWIRQLYDIEDRARELSVAARRQLRVGEAIPVLDKIGPYIEQLSQTAAPKSSLNTAVTYARNQWEALRRYTEDGRLTIDNNVSERTLRHQAIGRKNYLFLGSEAAGPRASVLYTVLAGAKRHQIEPWAYVRDLLERLPSGSTNLEELLPDRWALAHPEAILNHRLEESRERAVRTRARRAHRRAQRQ